VTAATGPAHCRAGDLSGPERPGSSSVRRRATAARTRPSQLRRRCTVRSSSCLRATLGPGLSQPCCQSLALCRAATRLLSEPCIAGAPGRPPWSWLPTQGPPKPSRPSGWPPGPGLGGGGKSGRASRARALSEPAGRRFALSPCTTPRYPCIDWSCVAGPGLPALGPVDPRVRRSSGSWVWSVPTVGRRQPAAAAAAAARPTYLKKEGPGSSRFLVNMARTIPATGSELTRPAQLRLLPAGPGGETRSRGCSGCSHFPHSSWNRDHDCHCCQ